MLPDFSFIAYFVEILEFFVIRIIPAERSVMFGIDKASL